VRFYAFDEPATAIAITAITLPSSVQNAGEAVVVAAVNDEVALTLATPITVPLPPFERHVWVIPS
jgi:hypothetical protein